MVEPRGSKPGGTRRKQAGGSGGELALIRQIQSAARRTARHAATGGGSELQLGIGDDCAILRPRRGEEIVVTTDFSLEGRHFRRDWHGPASIGHRALARGLSDLAAMGARPVAAFLSLALPRSVARDRAWLRGFLDGLLALAARADVPLAGGDTAEAPGEEVLVDIVLLGAVAQGRALRRDRAQAGDRLFVTGALGGAAAQLRSVTIGAANETANRTGLQRRTSTGPQPHFFPEPRLAIGRWLVQHRRATAAIDVSDGLSTDLRHLCEASGVAAVVDATSLPLHPLLAGLEPTAALELALHGGEDYELLFTAASGARVPTDIGDVAITEIGRVVDRRRGQPRMVLIAADGRRSALAAAGWEHLQ